MTEKKVGVIIVPDSSFHIQLLTKYLNKSGVEVVYIRSFGKFIIGWAYKLVKYKIQGFEKINIHWMPFSNVIIMKGAKSFCRFLGINMILTIHNITPHDIIFGNLDNDTKVIRYLTDWSESIVVHCEQTKKEVMDIYNVPENKIVVSPSGNYFDGVKMVVDPQHSRTRLSLPEDKILILIVSPCRKDKGLETFLHVVESLPNCYVGVIVGSCKDIGMNSLIESYVHEHPEKFIVKMKRISDEELADYYSAIDVVFMPYIFNTSSASIMEAACYGKAIVAPPMGNVSILVQDGVNGYLATSREEMRASLLKIDRNNSSEMGKKSVEIVKKFTWDDVAKDYKKIISIK